MSLLSSVAAKPVSVRVFGPEELLGPESSLPNCFDAGSVAIAGAWRESLLWLGVLRQGLGHVPYLVEARAGGKTVGVLPLAFVNSTLFGRFLVSLPYINSAGVAAETEEATQQLLNRAADLANELNVRHLELRHQREIFHHALGSKNTTKSILRLQLPPTSDELWSHFKSKLRSQIRSGERHNFQVEWGGRECLNDFYAVFCRNMRDLGTPVYSRRLFESILTAFSDRAELCIVRHDEKPIAAALLIHGEWITEVPSASSLRFFNSKNVNMVLYWNLLKRAIERGSKTFDFGRSTAGSTTFRFKQQWGAEPYPSVWQYHVRHGSIGEMRPENEKFRLAIQVWRRLPVWLTRLIGPPIVRGIP